MTHLAIALGVKAVEAGHWSESEESQGGGKIAERARGPRYRCGSDLIVHCEQWFGPPAAIARQSTAQQANAGETAQLLEVFAAQRVLREQHVVYFYHSASTRGAVGGVLLAAGVYSQTIVDRLWVLVDKQSGLVDDYVFRPKE